MNKETKLFAAYGTLMTGEGNHRCIEGAKSLGLVKTKPIYEMYHLGGFPGVHEGGKTSLTVEIFETDDERIIRSVNRLEGYNGIRGDKANNFYDTADVETEFGLAEIFIYQGTPSETSKIESGNWLERSKR
tara:strand:- start:4692 stop:5084 length:393 start_codon:yes stop_codon:yes gene_type:complete